MGYRKLSGPPRHRPVRRRDRGSKKGLPARLEEVGRGKGVDPRSGSPTRRGSARKTRSPAAGPSAERARARQATSERLGLYLRRDLPKGGKRRSPCHAALRHRGDDPASGRDRHANRAPGAHAAILLDQAGWHRSRGLEVPLNITLIPLPAKCPELNPQENVWFKVLRTDRRPLLRRLEQARRSALSHHLHRNARMGLPVLISASLGINYLSQIAMAASLTKPMKLPSSLS